MTAVAYLSLVCEFGCLMVADAGAHVMRTFLLVFPQEAKER